MKMTLALVVAAVLVATARPAEPPVAADLMPELRKGGYVLFLRHPQTDPDQADTDPLHLDNVKAQRHLTDAGRGQARAFGAALRKLGVPVGKVLASQFARARETAKLLDVGEVTTSVDVTEGGLVVSPRENQRRAKALRDLLGTAPAAGKNVVIVSHRPSLQDAAGKEFGDLGEGEVAVFRPLGDGKFKLITRVPSPDTWTGWAK